MPGADGAAAADDEVEACRVGAQDLQPGAVEDAAGRGVDGAEAKAVASASVARARRKPRTGSGSKPASVTALPSPAIQAYSSLLD